MIRRYCDACGKESEGGGEFGRVRGSAHAMVGGSPVTIDVEVVTNLVVDGVWKPADLCRRCAANAVLSVDADSREVAHLPAGASR